MCSDLNYFWPSPRFWYLNSGCSATLFASLFFTTVSSWLCDSQTCLSVNHWHSIRDSESISSKLRPNDATSTRTPLKKWICVLSVFIAIVPTHWLCQIQANPTGAEFLGTIFKFRKRNQFRRCLFTQSIKVMLREMIRNDDFCDNTTLQCWENVVGIRNNVATMLQCCVALRIVVATSP